MTTHGRVLVVDDESGIRFSLKGILEDEGFEVIEAESGEAAVALLEGGEAADLLFLDIWLPGMDGLATLSRIRQERPELPVIMISGHGTIETAVTALKSGAFDFIEKPLSLEKVILAASKGMEFALLKQENLALRHSLGDQTVTLTGESPAMLELKEMIAQVAPTDAWVLITGENGTGKEIAARLLHATSRRASQPLVAVNCAAIPEELIESELFGHEKGAFTGADKAQLGKFELAHKGTLFLDEIGDMSLKTQAKILRILQEQRFEHVGGRKTISVDVRVIAATNKDLAAEIKAGNFREDLYYRLKVFPLTVPPLRQRASDIPLLIEDFVEQLVRRSGCRRAAFSPQALALLSTYPWPGNVRELKNFVERMLIIMNGREVTADRLPPEILAQCRVPAPGAAAPTAGQQTSNAAPAPPVCLADDEDDLADGLLPESFPAGPLDLKQARAAFEARFLEAKLKEFGGNVSKLAEAVGLDRSSLYRKLKGYGIMAD
ncbi:two-component system, NtrC family, nitrogen regulation response regulator NtrX [Humidesulfovibrio mexicanus]|uniref:Two-component system, NtrC family, nitrogen regulation response regulator NtrX n=1 Tax=Humidesulfovibrio mexicanus TaxID=147047 RepID=A0A239BQU2_9BACT|nr:sigma-54 dependent transcriptional regulator [Humidesulfovibrio mexicanus]SNS09788.1 two-component system, NtrC family, nitrogen regulation response regulator NtrX [Humidesulfovibrio mexicanus]